MTCTLGVDVGTYETKGVLVSPEGELLAEARKRHEMIVPRPGWAEHRAEEDWWGDFVHVARELLAISGVAPSDVRAVACSAIGPCMLPVDAEDRPLMNAVLYGVDGRAEREVRELTERIGEDALLARCGNALTSQSVGPKILWLKRERPEIYARAARIMTSTTYLVAKLTGEHVVDHYTAANFAPLYDVERLDWIDDLAGDIVSLDKLPRLAWTTEIAGGVTAAAAAETGLAEGTPVTTGTIDAAAEAVSVGVEEPGDMMMMYGSTVFIIALTESREPDARLWYAPWLFPGRHAAMAGLATSGTLTHWFRDQFARELPRDEAFEILAGEAERSPPGARGLIVLPYFSGERTPIHDPNARGVIFGLDLTHTRGDLYRAFIEGVAHATRHVTDTFAELGQAPRRVFAVGGGVKNALWLQSASDATGLDQIVRERTIGASYGDALLAATAIEGSARAADWNPVARRVAAAPSKALRDAYGKFSDLYPATRSLLG